MRYRLRYLAYLFWFWCVRLPSVENWGERATALLGFWFPESFCVGSDRFRNSAKTNIANNRRWLLPWYRWSVKVHIYSIIRTRSDFEKHFTIKNCDKTFLKIISRLKKLLKSDDVSTLAERHYQVKISSDFWSINTKKKKQQ